MSYTNVSTIPLYLGAPSPVVIACNLVLTTSNGLTAKAAVEPATQPERKEHQNTASPVKTNTI